MVAAIRDLSVYQQQVIQRRERLAGTAELIILAFAFAASFLLPDGPLTFVLGLMVLVGAAAILLNPRIGLYLLLFCALFLEQWGIVGLDPLTAQLPIYQTLSGYYGF